jgi:hypothetical protein
VKFLDGTSIELIPGAPVKLNDEEATKLIARRPDMVRALDKLANESGRIVKWRSPLFPGELSARVLADIPGHVRVLHPLSEEVVEIPVEWLTPDYKVR